jgi:ADP-heptose:LPS heptosyltransferase
MYPEIYLSQEEKDWLSPVMIKKGHSERYWVINAGSKSDFPLKQYHRYQEVVNKLKDLDIAVVQCGVKSHSHKPLEGVIDMVGETPSVRELMRTIYHAEGLITCVSLPMHIAAAFRKPCVVVAGAREGTRWELYPDQRFLYVNGTLPCAPSDGCWRSKIEECNNKVSGVPRCLDMITPEEIVRAAELYYLGGMLRKEVRDEVGLC